MLEQLLFYHQIEPLFSSPKIHYLTGPRCITNPLIILSASDWSQPRLQKVPWKIHQVFTSLQRIFSDLGSKWEFSDCGYK